MTREMQAPGLGLWAVDCDDIPKGYQLPLGYEVDDKGVYLIREGKDGEQQQIRVTYAPVLPVGVYIDPAGSQLLELIWKDHNLWANRVVPRSTAKSGRRLITALGDVGLPAVDADARQIERWLAAVEACNRCIPRRPLARWLGWQADGSFVTSAGAPLRVEPAYEDQVGAIAAHRECGTLDGWQQALKGIDAYPVAKVSVYAGFAAPLLQVVGVDSFTIDISGRSTRGKTTAAKIGLSVWADPSEKGDGLFSWRTTLISVEKRLNICRGLPVVIDETRVVKFPELVDQVIYQVPKNHGQARGGGWPSLLPWSTIVISTGEQSALSFTSHQGAAARVLSIQRPPFGAGATDNGRAAVDVGRAIDENYGVAGPAFIARLQQHLQRPEGRDELRQRHRDLAEKYKGDSDMSGRRAPMVACLVLAAELVHEWGIVPFEPLTPDLWLELFTGEDPTDNRPEMALEVVREFVAANASALWQPGLSAAAQPATGWIGRRIEADNTVTVALLPERLREALRRANYTLDAVLPGWQELGYLIKYGDGRGAYQPVRALGETKLRMYVFTPGKIIDTPKAVTVSDG